MHLMVVDRYMWIYVAFLDLGNKNGFRYARHVCVHDIYCKVYIYVRSIYCGYVLIYVAFLDLGNKNGFRYARHVCVHDIYVGLYICGHICKVLIYVAYIRCCHILWIYMLAYISGNTLLLMWVYISVDIL